MEEIALPTFEEFKRNRERYLGRDDDALASADSGSKVLNQVQRHVYEIEGYRCRTLEEVERIANAQGIPMRQLDYRACIIPQSGHKCDILVKFVPKHTRERRASWG